MNTWPFSRQGGDLVTYRKRFVATCLISAAVAGGLLTATVALAVVPGTSSAAERHPRSALSGFAARFQDYATTAQVAFGGPKLIVRDCVEGGDGTAFCAYTIKGVCHGAMLTEQPVAVKHAGNVGLSALDCTARHALKWIGANG
jgi:hypothetical protein